MLNFVIKCQNNHFEIIRYTNSQEMRYYTVPENTHTNSFVSSSFEAFIEVMFQVIFWVVTLCNYVVGYQHFTLKMEAAWLSKSLVSYHYTT